MKKSNLKVFMFDSRELLHKIVLTGQCPSGKNAVVVTRSGLRFPSKRFKAWRDIAMTQIKACDIIDKPINVVIDYWQGDLRRRDVAGMFDAICHLLEKANIVKDDKWLGALGKAVVWNNRGIDRTNPRQEIYLYE